MNMRRNLLSSGLLSLLAFATGCSFDQLPPETANFDSRSYAAWRNEDPEYRLYPGDRLEVKFVNTPELNSDAVIAPDGRIALPLVGAVMAANLTPGQLGLALRRAYASELVDPALTVTPTSFDSQQVFVAGEVRQPGAFPLPGQIDVMQAITLAGGMTEAARPQQVVVMRRALNGDIMTRVLDLKSGLRDPRLYDIGPLRRFDVVYVPRSRIADQNRFIQQYVRDALPISFSFYYDLSGNRR